MKIYEYPDQTSQPVPVRARDFIRQYIFDFNAPYQRVQTWKPRKQSDYIHNLLKRNSPASIASTIIAVRCSDEYKEQCHLHGNLRLIDGKNRIMALKNFFDGKLPIYIDFINEDELIFITDGRKQKKKEYQYTYRRLLDIVNDSRNKFSKLADRLTKKLEEEVVFTLAQYQPCSDKVQAEMFIMINSAESLSPKEKDFGKNFELKLFFDKFVPYFNGGKKVPEDDDDSDYEYLGLISLGNSHVRKDQKRARTVLIENIIFHCYSFGRDEYGVDETYERLYDYSFCTKNILNCDKPIKTAKRNLEQQLGKCDFQMIDVSVLDEIRQISDLLHQIAFHDENDVKFKKKDKRKISGKPQRTLSDLYCFLKENIDQKIYSIEYIKQNKKAFREAFKAYFSEGKLRSREESDDLRKRIDSINQFAESKGLAYKDFAIAA